MNTVDVLREAKAILSDPAKWCRVTYFGPDGGTCAIGAVARVIGITNDNDIWKIDKHPALAALDAALPPGPHLNFDYPEDRFSRVGIFNDNCHREQRHADVIDAFDRAILAESAKQPQPEREPERICVG